MISLVADIGGTRTKLALVLEHVLLAQEIIEARAGEGLALQLPRIAEVFRRMCGQAGISSDECRALAVAFPSLVDREAGRVLTAYGKYEDAPRLDLPRWAREELNLELILENDARMALLGEWQAGAGRGCKNLVMVTLGTGLGTAAMVEGKLMQGKHGQAGVLGGHFTVRTGGRLCTCGNRGCAEAEASTSVLPQLAREHPDFLKSLLQEVEVIDYATVFHLARKQDACAVALRQQAIAIWSALMVNLIHAYDPERVIMGGGIMAGAEEFFSDLKRLTLDHAHTPCGKVEIMPAELGDSAALLGGDFLVSEGARS